LIRVLGNIKSDDYVTHEKNYGTELENFLRRDICSGRSVFEVTDIEELSCDQKLLSSEIEKARKEASVVAKLLGRSNNFKLYLNKYTY
jgi:hypothetical protein